jgi:hypothetical protein
MVCGASSQDSWAAGLLRPPSLPQQTLCRIKRGCERDDDCVSQMGSRSALLARRSKGTRGLRNDYYLSRPAIWAPPAWWYKRTGAVTQLGQPFVLQLRSGSSHSVGPDST